MSVKNRTNKTRRMKRREGMERGDGGLKGNKMIILKIK